MFSDPIKRRYLDRPVETVAGEGIRTTSVARRAQRNKDSRGFKDPVERKTSIDRW